MEIFDDLIDTIDTIDRDKMVNHVVFVLDHSGSMSNIAQESLSNLNENIQELRNRSKLQDTYVTLIEFNSKVDVILREINVNHIKDFDEYACSGTTALYDAVAIGIDTLDNIKELKDENSKHSALLIIMTDGYENASVEFHGNEGAVKIKEMIEERKKRKNFSVVFFGTDDIDVKKVGDVFNSFASVRFSKVDNSINRDKYRTVVSEYFTARDMGYNNMDDYVVNENHTFDKGDINVS
jgi:uncharacterized protein YegL